MRFNKRKTELKILKDQVLKLEQANKELHDRLSGTGTGFENADWRNYLSEIATDIENIGLGIYVSEDKIIKLSPVSIRLLGIKPEYKDCILENFLSIISTEDRALVQKSFDEALSTGKVHGFEYKIIRSDQERELKYFASKCKVIDSKENKKLLLFTLTDITRQEKTKREMLRAKEKAEESDRFKNIFLSNISREIRIPMNSIVGFAELLNIGNISSEDRSEYIKIIRQQSNLLLKLIDDISEIARFEAGEVKITKSICNLNLLLNELLGSFNQQKKAYKKENIELKLNIPEKKGLICYTDSGRLHQVLSNLIGNAIKFTKQGYVEFGYTQEDEDTIQFFVRDTGIGLNKEEQKLIFDRFKFNEETVTKKYEGSGLGLSIAKGIVKLLGGKIWLDSEPGKGTNIFFSIAIEQVPEENLQALLDNEAAQYSYNWKDKLILVVEDDDINYKFIETVLLENQALVIRAHNGIQAVELCRSINKIELILMDIKMPEMDGFEATRQIKKLNRNIPVIAQTAFALPEDREKCLDAGCDDHIVKPIDVKDMLQKINKYFNK